MSKDLEHLNLLVTFHYVVGTITAVYSSFPLIHVLIGLVLMVIPGGPGGDPRQLAPFRLFGAIFFVIGGAIVLFGWTLAALTVYAGRSIKRRDKYTFCLVVACLNCLNAPLGTALGVFTLIVLLRDSVRQMFAADSSTRPVWAPRL